jgi:multisubunit Na+/H+ antiporter MnhC subunit
MLSKYWRHKIIGLVFIMIGVFFLVWSASCLDEIKSMCIFSSAILNAFIGLVFLDKDRLPGFGD